MTTPPRPLTPGAEVDGLVVQEMLGQSSFSAIYRVTDPGIGTAFALKEFLPEGLVRRGEDGGLEVEPGQSEAFRTGLDGFRAEARVAARLDHPHLGSAIRFLERNGTGYLLMPLYSGRPLHAALTAWRELEPNALRAVVTSLMDAVHYLHSEGLVHGDIKPANILLRDDAGPVLLDFGASPTVSGAETRGSDGYAAPEQYDAAVGPTPAADIYGLAATLYRCLTDRRPPPAPERVQAVRSGAPDPLVPASRLLPADAAGGLGEIIDDGLKLDPDQRPSSVERWRRGFESLDWRVRSTGALPAGVTSEGREWLPLGLLAVVLIALGSMAWFLLGEREITWPGDAADSAGRVAPVGEETEVADDEERRQWRAALEADTVLGYRRFLERFPKSRFREQARIQLNILDERAWLALAAENTREAYADYLEQFPEGLHQAEALRRIEAMDQAAAQAERERLERERRDREAWETTRAERTVAAMDRYLSAWPAGSFVEEAQRIRRQLLDRRNDERAFSAARELDTREAYQAYLDAFPGGARVTEALEAIDRLTLRTGKIFRDCDGCPEMIVVPPGSFWQGSANDAPMALAQEMPQRLVHIQDPFAVGLYEVTLEQWDLCVAEGGCEESPTDNGWGRGRRPAIMVSWNDAQQYLRWLSERSGETYRLPTESEWEYFSRAGETGDWPFGDPARVCEFGNVAGAETGFGWRHEACSDGVALGTMPSGSLRPNDFGLFDVTGNVAEWTADCMNLSYLDAPVDGSAWTRGICSSHMARGGSWVTGTRDIRFPARFNLKNGDRNDFTGFRVVRDIDE